MDKKLSVTKSVLFDFKVEEIVQLNEDIRNKLTNSDKKKSRKQLTNKYNSRTNKRLQELITKYNIDIPEKEIRFHLTRRIYANIPLICLG